MEPRRRVTEEDLVITEALIAESYRHLKLSAIDTPSRALRTIGQSVQDHPLAAAGVAVVAGVAVCGIVNMRSSTTSKEKTPGLPDSVPKDTSSPNFLHEILFMILPLVVPSVVEYILKYQGENLSGE
ncbi:MAG: hypothetical protein V1862_02485 [Methanobacteriota archaeon]